MSTAEQVMELVRTLPDDLQSEVADFARFLKDTRVPRPRGKMKLDWRGALKDLRDQYTSVELQHKILEWRRLKACS